MDNKYIMLSAVAEFLKEITNFENETDFFKTDFTV